ncbi:MAG: LLM class flavin-dependent oxidoreductase [Acidimicrobiia bacterium]
MDAVVSLGYLAAVTNTIRLGSGIMQISARTPAATALTALSLAQISNDRFSLGLGVSGPQVVEGLHGMPFAHPLGRLREYVEIVRMGLRGERISYQGEHYVLPRPGGEGKALRPSIPPRPELPIHLATLGPKSLELTGELADGWIGTSFIPEQGHIMLDRIRAGAEKAGRNFGDIEIQVNASVAIDENVDKLIENAKMQMAFSLGAMGSADSNFYNDAYSRAGFADAAAKVQELWVNNEREAAVAAVPEEMVLAAYIIGTEDMVRDRIRAFKDAGVTTLRLGARGKTAADQISHLERTIDVIKSVTASSD